jgi:hypothetical protein
MMSNLELVEMIIDVLQLGLTAFISYMLFTKKVSLDDIMNIYSQNE